MFSVRRAFVKERLSNYANNANITGAPDEDDDPAHVSTVPIDEDISAGFVDLHDHPVLSFTRVLAYFRARQEKGEAATPDDVNYFAYRIPFTNYLRNSDGKQIGEFSNGFNDVSGGDWQETDNANNFIILLDEAGTGYPSPPVLRIEIAATDVSGEANLKQRATFTTPNDLTGGKLKLRVRRWQSIFGQVNSANAFTRIWLEFSSDDFASVHLRCKVLDRSGGTTNQDQGGVEFGTEVSFTLDAVDANSTGNALDANTAYRVRVWASKGGTTNTDDFTRDFDFIRIEFPNNETEFKASTWHDDDKNTELDDTDLIILDVRDANSPPASPLLGDLVYDIKNLHRPYEPMTPIPTSEPGHDFRLFGGEVLYVPFDNGSAADQSGNNHPATVSGAALNGIGVFNNANGAADFDGVNDFIHYGNITALHGNVKLCLMAWVKWQGVEQALNDNKFILHKEDAWELQMGALTAGVPRFVIQDPDFQFYAVEATTRVDDGNWHHVCGMYDRNDLTIWVDGKKEGTTNIGAKTIRQLNNNVEISDSIDPWDGLIDEVRMFTKTLTGEELRNIASFPYKKDVTGNNIIIDEGWSGAVGGNPTGWAVSPNPETATRFVELDSNLHLRLVNTDVPGAGTTITNVNKDIGAAVQKGMTVEFHYRLNSPGSVTANQATRFGIDLHDGSTRIHLGFGRTKVIYATTATGSAEFSTTTSDLDTDYIVRATMIFNGAGAGTLTIWRRVEGSSTWTRIGRKTDAGIANGSASGLTNVVATVGATAGDKLDVTCKYVAVARGRVVPLNNEALPQITDLKRVRLSTFLAAGAARDEGAVFRIDTMGVEEWRKDDPLLTSAAPSETRTACEVAKVAASAAPDEVRLAQPVRSLASTGGPDEGRAANDQRNYAASGAPDQGDYAASTMHAVAATVDPDETRVAHELHLVEADVGADEGRVVSMPRTFEADAAPDFGHAASFLRPVSGTLETALDYLRSAAAAIAATLAPVDDTDRTSTTRVLDLDLDPADSRAGSTTRAFAASAAPDEGRVASATRTLSGSLDPAETRVGALTRAPAASLAPDELRAGHATRAYAASAAPDLDRFQSQQRTLANTTDPAEGRVSHLGRTLALAGAPEDGRAASLARASASSLAPDLDHLRSLARAPSAILEPEEGRVAVPTRAFAGTAAPLDDTDLGNTTRILATTLAPDEGRVATPTRAIQATAAPDLDRASSYALARGAAVEPLETRVASFARVLASAAAPDLDRVTLLSRTLSAAGAPDDGRAGALQRTLAGSTAPDEARAASLARQLQATADPAEGRVGNLQRTFATSVTPDLDRTTSLLRSVLTELAPLADELASTARDLAATAAPLDDTDLGNTTRVFSATLAPDDDRGSIHASRIFDAALAPDEGRTTSLGRLLAATTDPVEGRTATLTRAMATTAAPDFTRTSAAMRSLRASAAPDVDRLNSHLRNPEAVLEPGESRVASTSRTFSGGLEPGLLRVANLMRASEVEAQPDEGRAMSVLRIHTGELAPDDDYLRSHMRPQAITAAPLDDTDRGSVTKILDTTVAAEDTRVTSDLRRIVEAELAPVDTRATHHFQLLALAVEPLADELTSSMRSFQSSATPEETRIVSELHLLAALLEPTEGRVDNVLRQFLATIEPKLGYRFEMEKIDRDTLVQALEDLRYYANMWFLREYGIHIQAARDSITLTEGGADS